MNGCVCSEWLCPFNQIDMSIQKDCTPYNQKVPSESYITCRFSLQWITHNYSQLRISKLNQLQWIIEFFKENFLKYCSDFRIVSEISRVPFPTFDQMENTGQLWFDCTWFCKVLHETREGELYLGWPASVILFAS